MFISHGLFGGLFRKKTIYQMKSEYIFGTLLGTV